MLCRFGDFLDPLAEYAGSDVAIVQEAVASTYCDLLDFCRHAQNVFCTPDGHKRRWISWRTFWRIQWIPFESEFGQTESNLQHHLEVVQHSATTVVLTESMRLTQEQSKSREREKGEEN